MKPPDDWQPTELSGWCAACGIRVESGEGVPGCYIPAPPQDHLRCLYLLCGRCIRTVDGADEDARNAVLLAVEQRIHYGRAHVA